MAVIIDKRLPEFHTELKDKAAIRQENSAPKTYATNRYYQSTVSVEIPANGLTRLVVE